MKRQITIAALLVWTVLHAFAHAAESDPRITALIEGAKRRQDIFCTSVETEFARLTAFETKYPYIKTDIFRSSHERIFSRLNVERKTGAITPIERRGLVKSPFAAVYPDGFKDPTAPGSISTTT